MSDKLNSNLLDITPDARVVILGVGSELRGDDVAGVKVVQNLKKKLDSPKLLLIDAGSAPENFTSKVRNFNPTHIILIDAVDFGGEPGKITHVNPEDIRGQATSTHRLPLSMLVSYLRKQTDAEVILIGIQPTQVGMNSKMTSRVSDGVRELTNFLTEKLGAL